MVGKSNLQMAQCLWLTGLGAKMLRGEMPLQLELPKRKVNKRK